MGKQARRRPQDEDDDLELAIVNWRRVRSEIEHEDNLTNHRLTWLFTSQAFLFTAFCVIFQAMCDVDPSKKEGHFIYFIILATVALLGIFISIWIWPKLLAAELQIDRLKAWWAQIDPTVEKSESENWILSPHPPIIGRPSGSADRTITNSRLPAVFIFSWVFFFGVALSFQWSGILSSYILEIEVGVIFLFVAIGGFALGFVWRRNRSTAPQDEGPPADVPKDLSPLAGSSEQISTDDRKPTPSE
jgi:hypothetical protein